MNLFDYIHKSPHRNHLEKHLKVFLPKLTGPIFDIGSKNRRYDHLLKVKPVSIDLIENKEKEVSVGDITNLNFQDSSFQSVICLEVLEYVSDFKKAISEISRVLVVDGEAVISVPFMYRTHQDKVRLTDLYIRELFGTQFSSIHILPVGNFYTIILDILKSKINQVKFKLLRYLCYLPYLFLVLFIPLFKFSKDESFVSGYVILAKK